MAFNGNPAYGDAVGPGSTFQAWAQVQSATDNNDGTYKIVVRYWVRVDAGTSGFGGTVTYASWYGNGNTSFSMAGSGDYAITDLTYNPEYGTTLSIPFSAWYNRTNGSVYESKATFQYTVPTPTSSVTFNVNGGTFPIPGQAMNGGEFPSNVITFTYGKTWYSYIRGDCPTRIGYTFQGWYTSKEGGIQLYNSEGVYVSGDYWSSDGVWKSNKNFTVYAQWTEHVITVNYYSNYADKSFEGALEDVDKNKNIKVFEEQYTYTRGHADGLRNYSTKGSSCYLGKNGYFGTGNYSTSPNGEPLLNEYTSFSTGQELAELLGTSIEYSDVSVNIYPQWTPANIIYAKNNNEEYKLYCVYRKINNTWKPVLCYGKIDGTYKQSVVKE